MHCRRRPVLVPRPVLLPRIAASEQQRHQQRRQRRRRVAAIVAPRARALSRSHCSLSGSFSKLGCFCRVITAFVRACEQLLRGLHLLTLLAHRSLDLVGSLE